MLLLLYFLTRRSLASCGCLPRFRCTPQYKERLAALIATDLPLSVSAPLIDSEVYWKRMATDLYQNVLPEDHGHRSASRPVERVQD